MHRHLMPKKSAEKNPALSAAPRERNTAAWKRLEEEVLPRLRVEAAEFADEIWATADDETWVRYIIAQRIADEHEPDPDFGQLTSVRMRMVLQCLSDRIAVEAPDRGRGYQRAL